MPCCSAEWDKQASVTIAEYAQSVCREEKGVKVRIEIGPKDAEQNICTIARSQKVAGLVAHKVSGDVGKTLGKQVQALLSMPDDEVPAGDMSKYEDAKRCALLSRALQAQVAASHLQQTTGDLYQPRVSAAATNFR